ncbi:hypothetical protein BZA77DRAFT_333099 [Pyronema omphalodes]|nr:hypothetical protein BZA77DRAFT_333099 [Pyronema omphalodes]
MNPYIRSSTRPATLESPMEGRETSYTAKNATIRTVASSDDMTPRRPSFFGDSPRSPTRAGKSDDGTGTGKQYQKEPWAPAWETGGDTEEQGPPRSPTDTSKFRPQTSPDSPLGSRTFFFDDDEGETHWPPSAPFRNILPISGSTSPDNRYLRQDSMDPVGKTRKSSTASNNIVDMRSIEKQYDDEARKMSDAGSLGLTNGGLAPNRAGESWIRSSTPTVTLQKDGHGEEAEVLPNEPEVERKQSNAFDDGIAEPNEDECEMARKIYEGDEEFVLKDQATAWLGDPLPERAVILKAYMRMFCWSGINILQAMRMLCERLVLRGETQQVDRIMVAFSHRWCEDNPNHGFKTSDIVHTILYSVLLLNTDIHVADIPSSQKMSRSQFVKNTMSTIRRVIQEATENEEIEFGKGSNKNLTAGNTRARRNTEDESSFLQSNTFPGMGDTMKGHKSRPSLEFQKEHKGSRLSRINLGNLSPRIMPDDQNDKDFDLDGGNALVSTAMGGSLRLWEAQVEIVLKDFYNSIKTTALPLHGSPQEKIEPVNNNPLAAFGNAAASVAGGMLNTATGVRTGRRENKQNLGATWSSKNRSRQRVYNGSFAGSSRTSLEDRSVWSPSASSTWSKYTLDKTQTSMSVDSLHSTMTHAQDYQASVGFANALSNAIIREEGASITSGEAENGDLLDGDDTLELEGAPWAKEGLLKHKHHLESVDKRAKNRGWTECFAVIQRGYMRLFQFPSKGAKSPQFSGGVVGGGNWTENAEPIGSFLLRQSIASALPPPGYSKSRPNVWALSLPSGAVHFFEVGTMDIVKEFVTTANYWSARLSKEPLIGGVSNVEYGWGDCLIDLETTNSPPPSVNSGDANSRQSLQISIRSSMDQAIRPRLPGDKLNLKDWTPPTQSMVASNMNEKDQLKALENYVANIEAELSKHNDLRPLMQLAFTPRHPNAGKAHANWEKKSSYLLREIIKFRTYIETLQAAINRRAMVDEKQDDDDVIPVGLSSMISTGGPPPKKETEKSDGDKKDGKDDEEDDEEEFKMSARLDGPARLELDFISSAFT